MVSLFTSLRIMMGVPLLGSIIKARILTSISMFATPPLYTILNVQGPKVFRHRDCLALLELRGRARLHRATPRARESLPPCGKSNVLSCRLQISNWAVQSEL